MSAEKATASPTHSLSTIGRIFAYTLPYLLRVAVVIGITGIHTACLTLRLLLIGLLIDGVLMSDFGGRQDSVALRSYRAISGLVGFEVRELRSYRKLDRFTVLTATAPDGFTPDASRPGRFRAVSGTLIDLWVDTAPGEGRGNGGFDRPFLRGEVTLAEGGTAQTLPDGTWRFEKGEFGYTTGDTLSAGERDHYIKAFCILSAILALVIGGSSFAKDYLSRRIYLRIAADIREDLYGHLSRQSVSFFDRQKSGDLISRMMNDAGTLQRFLHFIFDGFFEQPFLVIFSLAAAFTVQPLLTLMTIPFMAAIFIPVWRAGHKVKRHGKGRMKQLGIVTEAIHQLFTGIRILKAFGMEKEEREDFARHNRRYIRLAMKMEKAKIISRSTLEILYNLGIAVMVLAVGYLVARHPSGLGNFGIFLGALVSMYHPLKRITRAYNDLQETLAGAERVFEILDRRPDVSDAPDAVELPRIARGIAFRNVTFRYDPNGGIAPVLDDISFDATVGEVIGIVGQTGAGKTTLVDLIARFYEPQQGTILVDGIETRRATQASLLAQIAVVGQDPFLFNTAVLDNIRYGRRDATEEDVIAAAKKANIHDVISALPDGYRTEIGERGSRLSGGERQRVTIARALLKDAPILILDEATSALDSATEHLVQEALQNLMKNRLTFLIAHRLSTLTFADRILVLDGGRIAESGTHRELLARRGLYWRLYRMQHPENGGA